MGDHFFGERRPEPPLGATLVCPVHVHSGLHFDLVLGQDELRGQTNFGVDPVSRYCAERGRLPADSLAYLALSLVEPGDTVLDVGAHVGTFSLALASAGCRVIAVEASPRNAGLLEASVARNGLSDRLHVVHAAASDRLGILPFVARGPFGHVGAADAPDTVTVPALTIPEVLKQLEIDHVDLIKLDIEGHENEALAGMRSWLAGRAVAAILYEANHFCHLERAGRTAHRLKEQLRELGYAWQYRIDVPGRKWRPTLPGEFQGAITADYLALHEVGTPPPPWRLGRPASMGDHVRTVLAAALDHPEPWHLACLARVVGEAPPAVQNHPAVAALLASWTQHAEPRVREAVAMFQPPALGERRGGSATWDRATAWLWQTWARASLAVERHLVRPVRSLTRRLAG